MIEISDLEVSVDGRRVSYEMAVTGKAKQYFEADAPFFASYDVDVSAVPKSLLYVPVIANIMPVAWFSDVSVKVPELDSEFVEALGELHVQFGKFHNALRGRVSLLEVEQIVENSRTGTGSACFFSGGVDAFATLYRHRDKAPALLTLHGADINLDHGDQWQNVVESLQREETIAGLKKHLVVGQMRGSLSYRVDHLVEGLGWWGRIQHGLAMLGLVAPLCHAQGIKRLYIGASFSSHYPAGAWGSRPDIDENVRFAGVRVIHDGYDLRRQEKIELIASAAKSDNQYPLLRVCYNELAGGKNCGECEKCLRSILGLIVAGQDPRLFGLPITSDIYERIRTVSRTPISPPIVRYFWNEMVDRIHAGIEPFVLADAKSERSMLLAIACDIDGNRGAAFPEPSAIGKMKHMIINRFPRLFAAYLKLRKKFV